MTIDRPVHRESTDSKRAEVLAVASHLFREQGFHAVGMRAIGAAANIRAASLYYHFPSKQELLREAIQQVNHDFVETHLPILDALGTHAERFFRLIRAQVLYMCENRDAWWLSTREYHALTPENLAAVQADQHRYQQRIVAFVKAGEQEGEFSCARPELATYAILAMANDVPRWYSPSGKYAIEEIAEYYADIAVNRMVSRLLLESSEEREQ